jgi:hypothetical protein
LRARLENTEETEGTEIKLRNSEKPERLKPEDAGF